MPILRISNPKHLYLIGVLLTGISLVLYIVKEDLVYIMHLKSTSLFLITSILFLYGVGILLFAYLKGEKLKSNRNLYYNDDLKILRDELDSSYVTTQEAADLRKDLKKLQYMLNNFATTSDILTEDEKNEIIHNVQMSLTDNVTKVILKEMEDKYSKDVKTSTQVQQIRDQLDRTRIRLQREIEALGRRGNVNLVIGVITTAIAIYVLSSTVLSQEIQLTTETLISHFTPRFALSLFIEIFSFFFLRLYKSGLTEIKYFQNELTNVELKFVALENSIYISQAEPLNQVLLNFSATERNFILEKGQSTVDVEKSKIESKDTNMIITALTDLVKSAKAPH